MWSQPHLAFTNCTILFPILGRRHRQWTENLHSKFLGILHDSIMKITPLFRHSRYNVHGTLFSYTQISLAECLQVQAWDTTTSFVFMGMSPVCVLSYIFNSFTLQAVFVMQIQRVQHVHSLLWEYVSFPQQFVVHVFEGSFLIVFILINLLLSYFLNLSNVRRVEFCLSS